MSVVQPGNNSEDQLIMDQLLDVLENLEFENLQNLMQLEVQTKKIHRLQEEKIVLAREIERLVHRLSQESLTVKEKIA